MLKKKKKRALVLLNALIKTHDEVSTKLKGYLTKQTFFYVYV